MSLSTGETISRAPGYWTDATVSDMVIAWVEALAKHQGQLLLQNSNLIVENFPDQHVDEDEFDADYHPPDHDEPEDDDLPAHEFDNSISEEDLNDDDNDSSKDLSRLEHLTGTTHDEGEETIIEALPSVDQFNSEPTSEQDDGTNGTETIDGTDTITVENHEVPEETTNHEDMHADDVNDDEEEELTTNEVEDVETETHAYGLREKRTRSYNYRFASAIDNPVDRKRYYDHATSEAQFIQLEQRMRKKVDLRAAKKALTGWILTQMTAKAGIRRYGDAVRDAMRSEFRQLDEKGVFEPVVAGSLTPSVQSQALRCVNLIKEKRCGKIKGCTCADGRLQRIRSLPEV